MQSENSVKIEFLALSINESFARTAVSALLMQLDPTIDELTDVKTAVSEAVTNCIVHAYPNSAGKIVLTAATYPDKRIIIKIRDKGCGIQDISKAMEPLFTTGDRDIRSGLGFSVMQSVMDKVRVRSKPGAGTMVTLEKRIKGGNSRAD
ncbi:MAG: anti-sigma F factor [Oscillospiraceae bacterium]|nr:anti-sigma F factor [Oscillospiraceae bacterium]